MDACDRPLSTGSAPEVLRDAVHAAVDAGLSAVVTAPARDRRALKALLGPGVFVVPLTDPDQPLDAAADGVMEIPGRCVFLARETASGWDFVAVSGAGPAARSANTPPTPPPAPAPERHRRTEPVSLTSGVWFGFGFQSGWPAGMTPTYSLLAGPVVIEAGRTLLVGALMRDRWVHLGVRAPIVRGTDAALQLELVAGARNLRIAGFDTLAGPTAIVAVERTARIEKTRDYSWFLRANVGADFVSTEFAHTTGHRLDVYPVAELTIGLRGAP